MLRGWGNYFRAGNSSRKFTTVDSCVHMRLARLASNKHGLSHRNWARGNRFDLEWLSGLGVYRLTGTVRRVTAHAVRCTVSGSRVRENRTHGSTGGRWRSGTGTGRDGRESGMPSA